MSVTVTSDLPELSSLGRELSLDEGAFGFLETSNELLEDPAALGRRLEAEGYLYIKRFLDRERVLAARRSLLQKLAADDLLDPERDLMEGAVDPRHLAPGGPGGFRKAKTKAFRPDIAKANAEVERVVYGPELLGFFDRLFGEPSRHFDYTWLRVIGPGQGTPPHCDWVYMGRGSSRLLTCWTPYGDVPLEVGGLMILERSHLKADRIRTYLSKDVDAYCEHRPEQVERVMEKGGWSFPGWLSKRPDTLPKTLGGRWLTSPRWEVGDFLVFDMRLVHASLDNRSDRIRLSTDTRYQPASHPADERWVGPNPPGHGLAGKRGRIC